MRNLRHPWLFGGTTLVLGWILQVLFFYFPFPEGSSPQLLLVIVLAIGAQGHTDLAQTLGFLWGMGLDVFGVSLFGSQAWLLVLAGFFASRFSRQLNVEKTMAQEAVTLVGTIFFALGLLSLERIFRGPGNVHFPSAAGFVLQFLINILLAPPLFWAVQRWLSVGRGRSVIRD